MYCGRTADRDEHEVHHVEVGLRHSGARVAARGQLVLDGLHQHGFVLTLDGLRLRILMDDDLHLARTRRAPVPRLQLGEVEVLVALELGLRRLEHDGAGSNENDHDSNASVDHVRHPSKFLAVSLLARIWRDLRRCGCRDSRLTTRL
jgi:hypothetical protein